MIITVFIPNEGKHKGLTSVTFSTKFCFENSAHLKGNYLLDTSAISRINFKSNLELASKSTRRRQLDCALEVQGSGMSFFVYTTTE